MFRRFLLALIFMTPAVIEAANADKVWTLDECIRYAEEHNINIQKQALSMSQEELFLRDGRWAFVPTVLVSSIHTVSTGRVLDPTTYQFEQTNLTGNNSSSISSEITIFEGGQKIHVLNKAKLSLRAAILKDESVRFNLRLNVTAAYMDVLYSKEQVFIATLSASIIEAQVARLEILHNVGRITESDILQLRSQLFAVQNDIAMANRALQLARLSLCDLLEIDDYRAFEVAEPDFRGMIEADIDLDAAIDNHPDYRLAILNQEISTINLKIAKSGLYPRISLSAGYGSSFSDARRKSIVEQNGSVRYEAYTFLQQYKDNASAYISIGLSVPILTGMTMNSSVKRARIATVEAEYAAITMRKQLRKKILQAQIDCDTARDKYLCAQEEACYAQEAQRQIDYKYNLGTIDYLTWYAAVVELSKARYSLAEAKYTYYLKSEYLKTVVSSL